MTTPTYVDAAEVIAAFEELAATSVTRAEYDRHVETTSANLQAWAEELERLRAAYEAHAAHAVDQRPGPDWLHYDFRIKPEIVWAIGVAVGTVLLQATADVDKITDWKTWLIGVGAALIRAVIGALLARSGHKDGTMSG